MKEHQKKFDIVKTDVVYDGFNKMNKMFVNVAGLSEMIDREFLAAGHTVCVLIYDPLHDKILIVEEFRAARAWTAEKKSDAWMDGTVCGMVDVGNTALGTAYHEAIEEAGIDLVASEIYGPLMAMPSPGATSEVINHFIALHDLSRVKDGRVFGLADAGEHCTTYVRPRSDVMSALEGNVIHHGPMMTCLLWLELLILKGHIK